MGTAVKNGTVAMAGARSKTETETGNKTETGNETKTETGNETGTKTETGTKIGKKETKTGDDTAISETGAVITTQRDIEATQRGMMSRRETEIGANGGTRGNGKHRLAHPLRYIRNIVGRTHPHWHQTRCPTSNLSAQGLMEPMPTSKCSCLVAACPCPPMPCLHTASPALHYFSRHRWLVMLVEQAAALLCLFILGQPALQLPL